MHDVMVEQTKGDPRIGALVIVAVCAPFWSLVAWALG